jgi:amidophosphoribosyltransferase
VGGFGTASACARRNVEHSLRRLTDTEEKHEECGIVAIYSKHKEDVAPLLYHSMTKLNHRGQDAAGFVVFDGNNLRVRKGLGLVKEAFTDADFDVGGHIGIGHTRYPTAGLKSGNGDIQPFAVGDVIVAHNGQLVNHEELRGHFEWNGRLNNTTDSELIASYLSSHAGDGLESALTGFMEKADGAYSVVGMFNGKVFAFRDPHAIRPLVYGENSDYICFASETAALDTNGIPYSGDVGPGELCVVEDGRIVKTQIMADKPSHCMFEWVYFADPSSVIQGVEVYDTRRRLGIELAREHPVDADVVIPVPDTSRPAAQAFARELGIVSEEGLTKCRYVDRTFIMPSQERREDAVKLKLNPVKSVIDGKRVVLVDDSIVRGTTLRTIVDLVRSAGAKEVHVRITCPALEYPCYYGVDMKTRSELIAGTRSVGEIRRFIRADSLGYVSIDGLKRAIGKPLCTGCLSGKYPTPYARMLRSRDDKELAADMSGKRQDDYRF